MLNYDRFPSVCLLPYLMAISWNLPPTTNIYTDETIVYNSQFAFECEEDLYK